MINNKPKITNKAISVIGGICVVDGIQYKKSGLMKYYEDVQPLLDISRDFDKQDDDSIMINGDIKEVNVETIVGDVIVVDNFIRRLKVDTIGGSVTLGGHVSEYLHVSSMNASVKMIDWAHGDDEPKIKNIEANTRIKTQNGNIYITGNFYFTGMLTLEAMNGSIHISPEVFFHDSCRVSIKTMNGSIHVPKPLIIRFAHTNNGSCKVELNENNLNGAILETLNGSIRYSS